MTDNRFECGCERGGDCTKTTMCQVQDMADELEAMQTRVAELEDLAHRRFALIKTGIEREKQLRERIAELEKALRMFADDKDDCVSPGMKRLAEAALQEDDDDR
jgi:hypothetical protein